MAYPTAAEIRERVSALQDNGKFTDEMIDDLVEEFAGIVEDYRGVAFVPTSATDTVILDDPSTWVRLAWPKVRSITSVTVTTPAVGGTATALLSTAYTYDADSGHVKYPPGFACGAKVVTVYIHGLDEPTKIWLRACREYVRSCALTDITSVRRDVISQADGAGGFTRFSTADKDADRPTGWLEVDRLLNSLEDYRRIV